MDILLEKGFAVESIQDKQGAIVLLTKPRAGHASIYVPIPINKEYVPTKVFEIWMKTAGIARAEYSHLLSE